MFPVENRNNEYRNKDLVLGITLDSRIKAYPFKELEQYDVESFEDKIGDRTVTIEWLETENFARILDDTGEELPTVIAYWFAWYAFHPDTEVFRADDPK
jgi:hypothetical protein